jgi:iron complex outermembrane receptor protein
MDISLPRIALLSLLLRAVCWSQQPTDLTQLSVDDLAQIQVTSASRKSESLAGAPAAIYVLTGDAIRQSGFMTLPEALRLVPGLYVSQTNSHAWQVSTRGFAGISNNKLLVLVDGRSVYTPSFGGVYWDLLDIPVENIDRVEVIRGPGGTLWGSNAVNGVINIVTRSSNSTQGALVSGSVATDVGYTSFVQYGGRVGGNISYRLYGKASYWEPLTSVSGSTLPNAFGLPQGGMRADWAASPRDAVSLEATEANGRFQGSSLHNPATRAELLKDTNIALRWKHLFSDRSSTDTFAYCDWYGRQGFPPEVRNTCDMEFQHNFAFNARNSLIWGGSFVTTSDSNSDFVPETRRAEVGSGFMQYEYVVVPDRLRVLAGSKFEGNPFSGIEYQPQVRAVWTLNNSHSIWGAFSRAVRDPTRTESDLNTITSVTPSQAGLVITRTVGDPHLRSEHLKAYELGYRFRPRATLSFDISTYYNRYENLILFTTSQVQTLPGQVLITIGAENAPAAIGGTAQTHGAEFSANWQPLRHWMISPTVTEIRGSSNAMAGTPRHLFGVQSRFDLTRGIDFDAELYHHNALAPAATVVPGSAVGPGVPTFNRVDMGLSWRARSHWSFGVWGRNLQSDKHVEFINDFFGGPSAAIPRSVSFKLMWQSDPESK